MDMEVLECEVCFQQYDEDERKPRTLSCGHTLCTVCVTNGITRGKLTCPFCQKAYKVKKASAIPVSFSFLKVVRTLAAAGTSSRQTLRETPSSATVPTKTSLEPELHAGLCAEHGSYKLFWCSKCQVWVCRDCTVVEHPSGTCSVIAIKQALIKNKEDEVDSIKQTEKAKHIHENLLIEYQTNLVKYDQHHDEHIEAFQKIIERLKEAKCALKKEQEKVKSNLNNGHEAMEKMVFANRKLMEENTIEGITTARHCCQSRRKDTENWIDSSQADLEKADALGMSEKLHCELSLVMKVADAVGVSLYSTLISPFIDHAFKVAEFPESKSFEDVKIIAGHTPVWTTLDDHSKAAPVTLENDCLYLHALRKVSPPSNAMVLPYWQVRSLAKTPLEVFLDISWESKMQGRVTIKTELKTNESNGFLLRCSGEDNSFIDSKMIQVLGKNSKYADRLCGGAHGSLGPILEPPLPSNRSDMNVRLYKWVTLCVTNGKPCFVIWYKDIICPPSVSSRVTLGRVTCGIEVVQRAADYPKITEVTVSDCGLLMK